MASDYGWIIKSRQFTHMDTLMSEVNMAIYGGRSMSERKVTQILDRSNTTTVRL
jgi:hypothetical protein